MFNFKVTILLIFIFLFPGFTLLASLIRKKFDFSEFIFLDILISVIISGGVAFVLAEFGYFSLMNLVIIIVGICFPLLYLQRRRIYLRPFKIKINHANIAFVIILITSILCFTPPFEWTIGITDAGIYFNTGIHAANTGSLIIYDEWIANITPEENELFLRRSRELMIGFHVTDLSTGKVTPLLFHMWPTWIAIFHSLFGLLQSLYVTPFFGVLSILTIFFFTKRLFDWKIGLLSSSLLALNFVEIYFSKMPASEMLTQFLFFAGFYLLILSEEENSKIFPILSAACFAEALIARIDSILIIIPIFLYFLYIRFLGNWKKNHRYFVNSFCLFLIFYLLYANLISWQYFYVKILEIFGQYPNYDFIAIFNRSFLIILAILLAIFNFDAVSKYLTKKIELIRVTGIHDIKSHIKYLLSGLILVAFLYLYFIRPLSSSNIASDAFNLIKLSWFLWGLGIWLGFLGAVTLIIKVKDGRFLLFLGSFFIYAFFYLENAHVSRWMPWFARRHLPIVIPSLIIFSVYFCFVFIELISRNRFLRIAKHARMSKVLKLMPPILLIILFISSINTSSILFNHVENKGVSKQIDELAEFVGNDTIVFKTDLIGESLVIPLRLIHKKDARLLYGPKYVKNFQEIYLEYKDQGRKLLLVERIALDLEIGLSDYLYYSPKEIFRINLESIERPNDRVPNQITNTTLNLRIYEVSGVYRIKTSKASGELTELNYKKEFLKEKTHALTTIMQESLQLGWNATREFIKYFFKLWIITQYHTLPSVSRQ